MPAAAPATWLRLIGLPVDQAVEAAGMLHHHFPCLASMNKDPTTSTRRARPG
jgi:hypothetical protein